MLNLIYMSGYSMKIKNHVPEMFEGQLFRRRIKIIFHGFSKQKKDPRVEIIVRLILT